MSFLDDIFGGGRREVVLRPYTGRRPGLIARTVALCALAFFCLFFGFFYALTTPFLLKPLLAPLAILALIAIWALPDMKASPSGALTGLSFSFVLVLMLWPNYLAVALPGLPWITLIRLVTTPLALVLLISVSVSKEFREKMSDILSNTPVMWKLLVVFSIIQVVTIVFSDSKAQSTQRVFTSQLTCTAVFFASCFVFIRPGRVLRWAVFLWCAAILLCLIGLMEFKMLRPVWGAHVPSFLRIEDEQIMGVLSGSQRSATGQYRVQSTSTTSLGLSEMLALTVPFVIHFATYIRSYAVKVAAILSLPLMFYVVILTDSRLGMIGFLLSLMLYLLLWAVLRWRAAKGSLIAPAIVLAYPAIFTVFVVATFAVGRLRNMVWGNGDTAASDGARYVQYVTGIPKVLAAPWGYGASMGGGVLGYYQPNGLLTIDTYYLSVALEFGVLGFFTFYGMIMAAIYYAGRPVLKSPQGEYSFFVPLSISLVNFFVIKSVFSQQDNHPLVFMMMGIVAALAYRQSVEAKAEKAAL